jgi:hypothetical protein
MVIRRSTEAPACPEGTGALAGLKCRKCIHNLYVRARYLRLSRLTRRRTHLLKIDRVPRNRLAPSSSRFAWSGRGYVSVADDPPRVSLLQ